MVKWMKFVKWEKNKALFKKASFIEIVKHYLYFSEDNLLLDFDECDKVLKEYKYG